MTIVIVADLKEWVLGGIARDLFDHLSKYASVEVFYTSAMDGESFARKCANRDIVHFLSIWDYYIYKGFVSCACVVTLWHVEDWIAFDIHRYRLDCLLFSCQQWKILTLQHVPSNLPTGEMTFGLDIEQFCRRSYARSGIDAEYRSQKLEQEIILGFAGNAKAGSRKGLDLLFDVVRWLNVHAGRKIILRLVGKSWTYIDMPSDIAKNVEIVGFIDQRELASYYINLDIYLCLSRCEGVPYPVLEAMSCEVPVISTPVGVVPELITHQVNGLIVEIDSQPELIGKSILYLAGNPERAHEIAVSGRAAVCEKYDVSKVWERCSIMNAYEQAIQYYRHRPVTQRAWISLKARINRFRRRDFKDGGKE
jgi:glycosyltransferase involved in cell wall biosynthesis